MAGRGPRPAAPVIESPTGRPPRMRLLTPGLGLAPAPEIAKRSVLSIHTENTLPSTVEMWSAY